LETKTAASNSAARSYREIRLASLPKPRKVNSLPPSLGMDSTPLPSGRKKTEAKPQLKAANAFASIVPLYLDAARASIRDATYELQERYLNKHWKALHGLPLDGITRADVAASLTTIAKDNGPVAYPSSTSGR
jgi:hypothetical protein